MSANLRIIGIARQLVVYILLQSEVIRNGDSATFQTMVGNDIGTINYSCEPSLLRPFNSPSIFIEHFFVFDSNECAHAKFFVRELVYMMMYVHRVINRG